MTNSPSNIKHELIVDLSSTSRQAIVRPYVEMYFVPFIPSEITLNELQYDNTAECEHLIRLKQTTQTTDKVWSKLGIQIKSLGQIREQIQKVVRQLGNCERGYQPSPLLNQWIIDYLFELGELVKQYCKQYRLLLIHEYKRSLMKTKGIKRRMRKVPIDGYIPVYVDWNTVDLTINGYKQYAASVYAARAVSNAHLTGTKEWQYEVYKKEWKLGHDDLNGCQSNFQTYWNRKMKDER